jgi:hypothetical protein
MIVAQQPDADTLVIETSQCRIRPPALGNATSEVSVPPGGTASVTVRIGSISVTEIGTGQERAIGQGETFVCPNLPAGSAPQAREESKPAPGEAAGQAPPSEVPKHSNTSLWVLLLGGGAAAGIGAAIAAGGHGGGGGTPASPSAP